jgi:hypothetical protein
MASERVAEDPNEAQQGSSKQRRGREEERRSSNHVCHPSRVLAPEREPCPSANCTRLLIPDHYIQGAYDGLR